MKNEFKIDVLDDIEKEIESFFKKGIPVNVRKLNEKMNQIQEYLSSLKNEEKTIYKVEFISKDKAAIFISEKLALNILENLDRTNIGTFNNFVSGYDEDTDEIIIIAHREIAHISIWK